MIKNLIGGLAVAMMVSSGAQAATANRSADAIPATKYVNASAAKAVPSACNLSAITLKSMKKSRTGTWVNSCGNPQFMQGGAGGIAPATASTLELTGAVVAAGASVASLVIVADRSN